VLPALLLVLVSGLAAQAPLSGVVHDATGGAIPGAVVIVRAPAGEQRTLSGTDGTFALPLAPSGPIEIIVRAGGFGEKRRSLGANDRRQDLVLTLSPAIAPETITVTATRGDQQLGDTPASVTVLGRDAIRRSAAVAADDVLRQVPTFSLVRRTSSLASHPTAQGVSLRGIGPSGVSRTLVLLDGIPFNDPFGGWVYWSRVPIESAERIEIVDSGSSSLYGNYAMGGVINIVTTPPVPRTVEVRTQYGNRGTPKVDVLGTDVWGKVGVTVNGTVFDTNGYTPVVESERGRVDKEASVSFRNFRFNVNYAPSDRVRAFAGTGYFREERDNGKASTIDGSEEANDTSWTSVNGGIRLLLPGQNDLQATVFADAERFRSNFLAVPASTPLRSVGRMTLNQFVPTTGVGGLVQWSRPFGGRHFFTAGTDWRWIEGESREDGLDATTGTQVTLRRLSGGAQQMVGIFAQGVITPAPKLVMTISARVDRWRNYDGHNLESSLPSGVPTAGNAPSLADRSDTALSPRLATLYRLHDRVRVWGSVGAGFRAPTLNELYRQFRVGTVLTLANNQLGPERLRGGEAGISIEPLRGFFWKTTWFDNRVTDPVSNVTLTAAGANVTQQRQNLGRTHIRGVQTDVDYNLGPLWQIGGAYIYNRATVAEFAANPSLVDKLLPQVPSHRGSLRLSYVNTNFAVVSLAVQSVGSQFDDDLNARAVPGFTTPGLPGFTVVDISASRPVGRRLEVFGGVQNLLNKQFYVGTLPTTVGAPRFISVGVRVRISGGADRRTANSVSGS
jgi:iron complex outermembrane receptor protein